MLMATVDSVVSSEAALIDIGKTGCDVRPVKCSLDFTSTSASAKTSQWHCSLLCPLPGSQVLGPLAPCSSWVVGRII